MFYKKLIISYLLFNFINFITLQTLSVFFPLLEIFDFFYKNLIRGLSLIIPLLPTFSLMPFIFYLRDIEK
jgi:hypothetical protein